MDDSKQREEGLWVGEIVVNKKRGQDDDITHHISSDNAQGLKSLLSYRDVRNGTYSFCRTTLLQSLCLFSALKCATALVDGKLGIRVDVNGDQLLHARELVCSYQQDSLFKWIVFLCLPSLENPSCFNSSTVQSLLYTAVSFKELRWLSRGRISREKCVGAVVLRGSYRARFSSPELVKLFLHDGARTDVPFARKVWWDKGMLPLNSALYAVREAVTTYQRKYLCKWILSLFLPALKQSLAVNKLLVESSNNIEEFAYYYAMEGKLVELAVLLFLLEKKVLNGRMMFPQCIRNQILSLIDEEDTELCVLLRNATAYRPSEVTPSCKALPGRAACTKQHLVVFGHGVWSLPMTSVFCGTHALFTVETNQVPNSIFGGTSFDAQVKKGTKAMEQNMPKCLSREKLSVYCNAGQEGSRFIVLVDCRFLSMALVEFSCEEVAEKLLKQSLVYAVWVIKRKDFDANRAKQAEEVDNYEDSSSPKENYPKGSFIAFTLKSLSTEGSAEQKDRCESINENMKRLKRWCWTV
ncbi:hypothetical protein RHSIM_Rhsim03G0009800 [Rhododendron simsii]|uniref:Uncharacterized protein n=1 Tax=Rhododendron simsii TaxID=118357 RepID=A0A834H7T3_RHOSS|nr:hypothetical protein RHSIM_Rhsim03G0009800 [Rhododendron simsii]